VVHSQLIRGRRSWLPALVAAGTALLVAAGASPAVAGQPAVVETPIHSTAPDASQVLESYVSLYAPLPASDGPHPAACDRIGYLRFRAADGPSNPAKADAIFVAQPGIFEGAGAFDQVARHTIEAAEAEGYHVEFWAINRRSNCLVDDTGVLAAEAARNPQVAFDYYFGGSSIDGQKFAGPVSESDAEWLSHVGIAQTVEDEYTVISQLPPAVRRTKVFCGGHSLGGFITGVFANWDFSGTGNPADAGYNQCAGYFALDTRLSFGSGAATLSDTLGGLVNSVLSAVSSWAPYIDFPPISPETEYALPILGMASYWDPNGKSTLLSQFPADSAFNFTYDVLLTDSWSDFFSGVPNARLINATNQAVVGEVFGNNSQPFAFLRAALGAPTGGPVIEKNFPVPYGSPLEDGLLGGPDLVTVPPADATGSGPLYSWLNYNQVPTPGPSPSDDPGHPYTSAADEVSDITQFSRTLFQAAPGLFTEPYFPTQLALDTFAVAAGDDSGTLSGLRYTDGVTQHPAVYVDAGDGLAAAIGGEDLPDGPQPQVHVVAPGYNHLDVLDGAGTRAAEGVIGRRAPRRPMG